MTGRRTIDQLIINSPYDAPAEHWRYNRGERFGEAGTFTRETGRRPAGYHVPLASDSRRDPYDPGQFVELPLVNQIRTRVDEWRAAGYPGATGITRRLLDHWLRPEREPRFFFCQAEAAETLIWSTEAPAARKVGIEIPSDGGPFPRLCAKMATGAGKTVVMAMVTAWQILNKVTAPQDARFSRHVLVVAPGLTVRSRLAVLDPAGAENYYAAFDIVPSALRESLRRGQVLVHNWHALNWETEARLARRRSVDKRGARSDAAYVRDVLGEMATARRLLVINDEAHHAWRIPADGGGRKVTGRSKAEIEEATKWVGGLDRIAKARGILACYDFSATPFTPAVQERDEALFSWIVSDFGLNDAIESGLVKTPRVVVRDDARADAKTDRSRLYHLYGDDEVKDDLNRKAQPHEPLPDLVVNGYHLLGHDWDETRRRWEAQGHPTRPVLITVTNRTETAARIKHAFDKGKVRIDALRDPERTLHIDSKVLGEAEASEEPLALVDGAAVDGPGTGDDETAAPKLTRQERAELLRRQVDTVGRPGQPGERIQNVVSVGMLSEGWDARTVTHIMGLRAFTSQLLCEQVVGRGLRRTSYDVDRKTGRFTPEHVNVFGIPFPFLPHEQDDGPPPPPPPPKTAVMPVPEKVRFEITWPNVVRVAHVYRPRLSLDIDRLDPLELDARRTARIAELAEVVDGVPDVTRVSDIDLDALAREFRTQRIVFETAGDIYDQMQPGWRGGRTILLAQLVRLVERVIASDRIRVVPESPLFGSDRPGRRLVITLNMTKVVQHLWEAIRFENAEALDLVLDRERPIVSTDDTPVWHTGRPCRDARRSHINYCVCDSGWEADTASFLDRSPHVAAWVKNDHLGFHVLYLYTLLSHRISNLGGLNLLCLLEWFCHKSFKTQEIQAVAHHNTVFGQFLALLPRHEFDAESREHQRGQRLRVMSRWAQFVALGLGQLTGRQSLRDIVANLQVQSSKLYHLGVRTVSRSSLARVNAEQPYTLYEAVFSRLLSRCQQQAPGHGFRFKHKLYAVDASTIDLCLALFPWATFRRTKAAVKLHVGLDQAGQLPSFVSLTEGKRGDVTVARTWQFPAGSVVVADRAYLDFKWLHQLPLLSHRISNLGGLNLLCLLEWFCHKSFKTQEIQAVAHHNTVFGQFLALLPRHEFDAESREHQRGQRLRVMSRWAQFVALGLGQLTGRQSLRDIVANLQVQSSKLYHLGVRTVSRSSLARVNAEQPYTLYEAVFSRLLSRCQQQAPGHGFRFKHKLYAVDASTIDLCLALFPWATFRRTKAAVKLHVGLDQAGQLPSFVSLTEGKRGDVTVARTWQFPAGSVVVADRAYLDFKWLHQLQTRSVTFVTRLKRGVRYRVTHEHDVRPETGVLADQRIELTSARSGKAYPDPLRRVVYRDPQTKNRYVFVTNNTTWVAKTIADIYKSRWQIELFFKWIKQHLKVKRFIGRSKNAVWTQLWIATCMYLLLAYLKFVLRLRWSLNQMLQVLQLNIFERRPLHELFTTHAPPDPDRPQLALAWT